MVNPRGSHAHLEDSVTSRDHKLIANVLLHARERGEDNSRTCEYFALILQQDNSRFSRDKFLVAAGYVKPEGV